MCSFRPDSDFTPEKKIIGRVDDYPNDITVLTVPYNSGILVFLCMVLES